tara:strand:- start:27193 stop:27393 length:201 start_codon:yes stop_codon:yes gene_type:complete
MKKIKSDTPGQERVLSYQLSEYFTESDLKNISGGGGMKKGSSNATARATFSQHGGADAEADVNYDL